MLKRRQALPLEALVIRIPAKHPVLPLTGPLLGRATRQLLSGTARAESVPLPEDIAGPERVSSDLAVDS